MTKEFKEIQNTPYLMTRIFKFFDSKTLLDTTLVNKKFHETSSNIDRLIICRDIFSKYDLFKNETPESMGMTILQGGYGNRTYLMQKGKKRYVVRLPGNSELFVDRKSEGVNSKIAYRQGTSPEVLFFGNRGEMITRYIPQATNMKPDDFKNFSNIKKAIDLLKKTHQFPVKFNNNVNIFSRLKCMEDVLSQKNFKLDPVCEELSQNAIMVKTALEKFPVEFVPCHLDPSCENFIYKKHKPDQIFLIDWEHSGNFDPVFDLTTLSIHAGLSKEQELEIFSYYYDNKSVDSLITHRFELYKPIVYYWLVLLVNIQIMDKNFSNNDPADYLAWEKLKRNDCLKAFSNETFKKALDSMTRNNFDHR